MKHKKKKKTPRQVAGEKLLVEYAKLTPYKRDLLQETLLQHAFLSAGEAYMVLANLNKAYFTAGYTALMHVINDDVAEAWLDWAEAISLESPSAKAIREIILDFVAKLVRFRSLECVPSQNYL
jgi:hypothetical protein